MNTNSIHWHMSFLNIFFILLFVGCVLERNDRKAIFKIYNHISYIHSPIEIDTINKLLYSSNMSLFEIRQYIVSQDSINLQRSLAIQDTLYKRYMLALHALGNSSSWEDSNKVISDYMQPNEGQGIWEEGLRFELAAISIWKPGMSAEEVIVKVDSLSKGWHRSPPNQALKLTVAS